MQTVKLGINQWGERVAVRMTSKKKQDFRENDPQLDKNSAIDKKPNFISFSALYVFEGCRFWDTHFGQFSVVWAS